MSSQIKTIAVLGAGKSGIAAALLALDLEYQVNVYETGFTDNQTKQTQVQQVLEPLGARCFFALPETVLEDLIVISPGIDPKSTLATYFSQTGKEVIGELEFGWRNSAIPAIAITGTNGKTTTTEMIGHILSQAGLNAPLGGNHGIPLCQLVLEQERRNSSPSSLPDYWVLEVSSFQAETAPTFHPKVVVWTNFAADHLDRYANLEEYYQAKKCIVQNLDSSNLIVLHDQEQQDLAETVPHLYFGHSSKAEFSCNQEGNLSAYNQTLGSTTNWKVQGKHNFSNALAAIAACEFIGISPQQSFAALAHFSASAHRYERVAFISEIEYINDSKATNLHAVISALQASEKPLHLLLGGAEKGLAWEELHPYLPGRILSLYTFGAAANSIYQSCSKLVDTHYFANLEQAFLAASNHAQAGDQILLSPGCASFDQYKNYAQRGEHFRQLATQKI